MLVATTTAKDRFGNLERFVARNLAGGLDHLILYLDAEQPEVIEGFREHPHVTCVAAWDESWWGPSGTPPGLNTRQNLNANLSNAVLTRFPWAHWLFHIDADEVVQLNRRLERLDPACRVVRLGVWEAVSHEDAGEEWFKRRLKPEERSLLVSRGFTRAASNSQYFRGHLAGKSGWRPSLDLRAAIHVPLDASGRPVPGKQAKWLRVLHLESTSAREFARKWLNLVEAGLSTMAVRHARHDVATAVADLVGRTSDPSELEEGFARIYDELIRDPFDTLRDLDLLVHLDLDAPTWSPRTVPVAERDRLRSLLESARGLDTTPLLGPGRAAFLDRLQESGARP